ncbi:MAG: hypothetical protein ACRDRJ_10610 [Streptosporangiaceae bacterium]
MRDTTIEVSGLRKRFGPTVALDGMTIAVSPGQVTGFIGPNGAGSPVTELWLSLHGRLGPDATPVRSPSFPPLAVTHGVARSGR